jgi:hypothetical protein
MSGPPFRRASPLAAAPSARPPGPAAMLLAAIERLQSALEAENAEIASRRIVDFRRFNLLKSQGLLELTRLGPMVAPDEIGPTLRAALFSLKAKLEDNRRVLRVQLKAAQQVSEVIARTIQAGQSDGTYSAYAWRE